MAAFLLPPGITSDKIFDSEGGDLVELIEVSSDNSYLRRTAVTDRLCQDYIEKDFDVHSTTSHATTNPTSEHLKLFFSIRQGKYDGAMVPIPISSNMFKRIAPYARIPRIYLESLARKTAIQIQSTPQLPPDFLKWSPEMIGEAYLSFIIQPTPAQNRACIGCSFTYHFKSRHMYAFMHGLNSPSIEEFVRELQDIGIAETYFLIPSLIIHRNLEHCLSSLNIWHDAIYDFEKILGVRTDHRHSADPKMIDFTRISQQLNDATTNMAFFAWQFKSNERLLEFLDSIARKYENLAVKNGYSAKEAESTKNILLETHEYIRVWNAGLADRVDYLSKRAQALVQTVYSSIAQRDSANSLSLATTSTKLAETSQGVAIATSRDSAVMRIIAAITIFFLPATFTATFFSTSFFDFHVGRSQPVYSWWLWLYFLVTLILTAITMVGTWALWKNKENEIARQFPKTKG
ncbi:uncharacterized protein BDR25DRAFT_346261 [Lindgomyces ingoldianus]|uniref:Uncharacterized protein n=1 Tax=Lindgomyces ingoldianus TaxID=673940 RepID=A0ACB6QFL5_9PLEO|nr:uncharacterized protein BDR25DRAFT_346261 [Lindgomyces ingoldianus]KAF2465147.1 hypothetical protein BDR25DRAFT_346261 [Lindgomyces ingoldianus]